MKHSSYKEERFAFGSQCQKFHSMVTRSCGFGAHGDTEHCDRQHTKEQATHLMASGKQKRKNQKGAEVLVSHLEDAIEDLVYFCCTVVILR